VNALARTAPDFEVIYASMAPYESAEAAATIARESKRPWVADLRDPWALDEMIPFPTALHRQREARHMRRQLSTAAALVMSTSEAERRVREAFPELADKPIATIPNGYDPADFADPPPERTDSAFRIVHTGYLHAELGLRHRKTARIRELLGGSARGLDILTRSHVYLLEAIGRLIREEPSLASTIEVHLAGVLTETDRRIADRSPVVRLLGYVPHRQTVELVRSADLLFLPMHDLPPGVRASIIPGKTYEYIASGRPILAAVPDGDARDILKEAGTAHLCRPADVDAMVEIIRSQIERWSEGEEAPPPDPALLERLDYRNLARQLADVFDDVVDACPDQHQSV
jgi:glycosyltransferase involved in cell wall biosynthesis